MSAGRPRKGASQLTLEGIVSEAMRLLRERGDSGLTFRAIAESLGVTPMAISHRVGSRRELLAMLVRQSFADVGTRARHHGARSRIMGALDRYGRRVAAHPVLTQCIFSDPTLVSEPLLSLTENLRLDLRELRVDETKLEATLNVLIDYTHGFALSASAYRVAPSPQALKPQSLTELRAGLEVILGNKR